MSNPFERRLCVSTQDLSVMIGMPCGSGVLPWQTVQSLVETCLELKGRNIAFELQLTTGCSIVHHARSYVANHFMASKMNRLFMIDADMQWRPEDFIRLLGLSVKMDVVCASYPIKQDELTFLLAPDDLGPLTLNEFGCAEIHGAGLGFTVVGRTVMERLSAQAQKVKFSVRPDPIPYVFRCDVVNGEARGEDMAFFRDVSDLGYKVHMDPTVKLGHIGTKTYSGAIMSALQPV